MDELIINYSMAVTAMKYAKEYLDGSRDNKDMVLALLSEALDDFDELTKGARSNVDLLEKLSGIKS